MIVELVAQNLLYLSFACIHVYYGLSILLYTFFALYLKRGVSIFLAQELVSFLIMVYSFKASMG